MFQAHPSAAIPAVGFGAGCRLALWQPSPEHDRRLAGQRGPRRAVAGLPMAMSSRRYQTRSVYICGQLSAVTADRVTGECRPLPSCARSCCVNHLAPGWPAAGAASAQGASRSRTRRCRGDGDRRFHRLAYWGDRRPKAAAALRRYFGGAMARAIHVARIPFRRRDC